MNHDRIAELYNRKIWDSRLQEITRERIHWICANVRGSKVLDIGCSQGIVPLFLAREGYDVIGLDVNSESIEYAKEYQAREFPSISTRCQYICGDIFQHDFEEEFDTIILAEILEHFSEPAVLLKRAMEFLASNGRIVITVPFGIHRDPDHKSTHTVHSLYRLLSQFLHVEEINTAGKYIKAIARQASTSKPNKAAEMAVLENLLQMTDAAMLQAEDRYLERQLDLSDQIKTLTANLNGVRRDHAASAQREAELIERQLDLSNQIKTLTANLNGVRREHAASTQREAELKKQLEGENFEKLATIGRLSALEKELGDLHPRLLEENVRRSVLEKEKEHLLQQLNEESNECYLLRREEGQLPQIPANDETRRCYLEKKMDWVRTRLNEETVARSLLEIEHEELSELLAKEQSQHEEFRQQSIDTSIRYSELERLNQQLTRSLQDESSSRVAAEQERAALSRELDALELRATEMGDRISAFETELEKEKSANESYLTDLREKSESIDELLHRIKKTTDLAESLETQCKSLSAQMIKADQEIRRLYAENQRKDNNYYKIRRSVSYQFGHSFLNAIFRPGMNTLRFPAELVRIVKGTKNRNQSASPAGTDAEGSAATSCAAEALLKIDDEVITGFPQELPAGPRITAIHEPAGSITPLPFESRKAEPPRRLKVASILDTFTHACFAPECDLIPIGPDNWIEAFKEHEIDMLFVESAWHGNDDAWLYRVAKYNAPPGNELSDVIAWCGKHNIPTVFWNKEDPPNFDRFVDRASEFNFIFTTDENCIPRYKERCPNAHGIEALPFAAQPSLHNPILKTTRLDKTCFAGTYYADCYEERREWMDILLRAGAEVGLDFFDRMHDLTGPQKQRYLLPKDLREYVRGKLDYDEMIDAYRRYRTFLNVNSVYDSPTMFSRRVYELLACGTPVVSTPSLGIERYFGDLVPQVRTMEEAREALKVLMTDTRHWLRTSALGVRRVFSEHTYRHRMETVCHSLGIGTGLFLEGPLMVIVNPTGHGDRFVELLKNQTLKPVQAVVVGIPARDESARRHLESLESGGLGAVALPVENIPSYVRNRFGQSIVALCDSRRYYGPNYLLDAVHAVSGSPDVGISGILPHLVAGKSDIRSDKSALGNCGLIGDTALSGSIVLKADRVDDGLLSRTLDDDSELKIAGGCFCRYGFEFASSLELSEEELKEINLGNSR